MTEFLSHTLSSLAACRSQADFYKIRIDIMERATPAEMGMLLRNSNGAPAQFTAWLQDEWTIITNERPEIQPFQRSRIAPNILFYRGPARGRTLVVAFCGKAGLLFLPIPAILQFFKAEESDVLVIRDPARMSFVDGIAGYAGSFPQTVDRLRRDLNIDAYDEVRTFGTSGGGGPALAGGVLLGARHAVSLCGHFPTSSSKYGAHPGSALMERIMRASPLTTGYYAVFGDANAKDTKNAAALHEALGVRLRPVPGVSEHNVIFELHKERAVGALFREVGLVD
jgi:hypothetical protein